MEKKKEIGLPEYSLEIWEQIWEMVTVIKESLWFPWCHLPASVTKCKMEFLTDPTLPPGSYILSGGCHLRPSPPVLTCMTLSTFQAEGHKIPHCLLKMKVLYHLERGRQCITAPSGLGEDTSLYVSSGLTRLKRRQVYKVFAKSQSCNPYLNKPQATAL